MKYLIALLGFAALCTAQTSPTIVSKLTLKDQTTLVGSSESPIPLYTPTEDGFYRMTMYISSSGSGVLLCHPYPPNSQSAYFIGCAYTYQGNSSVIAFPVKAGQAISYYTINEEGTTFSGSYNINIVIEHLY
jgi:hypothetical protein